MKDLVEAAVDISEQDEVVDTTFMFHTEEGHVDCSMELILAGAEIDKQNGYGSTALTTSKWTVKELLKSGECCRQ